MREIRPSGARRGERVAGQGMRFVRPARGNPDTELGRNLNAVISSPTLPSHGGCQGEMEWNETIGVRAQTMASEPSWPMQTARSFEF